MNDDTGLSPTPSLTAGEAQQLAWEQFAVSAKAVALPSERDQNFSLLCGDKQRYVLKIAKADEERCVLELQNATLAHLGATPAALAFQRTIPSKAGADIVSYTDRHGRSLFVRLVTWLEGELFAKVESRTPRLLMSLGAGLADMDSTLAAFTHPAMHRQLHWDLKHMHLPLQYLRMLNAQEQAIVTHFQRQWSAVDWTQLRQGVIHADANDYNILVRNQQVVGLLDFGDMVHSAIVGELCVALAYAMLEQDEPLEVARAITSAYHERLPLTCPELDAIFPLSAARLCMSVCYAAHNARAKSDDAYQIISQAPAWNLLRRLVNISPEQVTAAMRSAVEPAARTLAARRRLLGGSLSCSYRQPLHLVRGSMQYLYDHGGREYLDAYNNVPHVGHCHPNVVAAARFQLGQLNTNTRYLSDVANTFASRLTALMPAPLRVCFFVNSGSEANELALRLARAHTGARDLIVLEHAYHGNTNTMIDISPYKHLGPGGRGTPDWVHIAPLPDLYRGAFRQNDPHAGSKYAAQAEAISRRLQEKSAPLCGFIAESWPSVGGQICFPKDYLNLVYASVRAAGGLCIADEVQTGYGRLGDYQWGFEHYGVVPDIVVLGKPIGNGYPLGAVVTTAQIAASFDNGMEFFSTFGGSTVSCAVGLAVLDTLQQESLREHARVVGIELLEGLRSLMHRHALIGDVRGSGLFLGAELVRDRHSREPATQEASNVVNALREQGVLIGTDGPHDNVLKIRPPMPFNIQNAHRVLETLDAALSM